MFHPSSHCRQLRCLSIAAILATIAVAGLSAREYIDPDDFDDAQYIARRAAAGDTIAARILPTTTVVAPLRGTSAFENHTTLSREAVERLNILSMKQVSEIAPNFYIPDYGSRMTSSIYMRGIGARIDQAAVGLMVDGVALLNKDNYDFDMADISRITVTRGPQSSLYGRNTMAGMITINTLSPMEFTGVRASLEGGSAGRFKANAGVYLRPCYNWGTSLTADFSRIGGYFTNIYNNSKADRDESASARWKVEYRGAISLTNTASVTFTRQHGYPYASIETGHINYNDTCFYRRIGFTDGLSLKASLGHLSLTSKTSAQFIDDNMTLDQDFLPASYFTLTQKRREWAFTEDVTLDGAIDHPFGDKTRYAWLGGLFGFYKRSRSSAPVTFKETGIEKLIVNHRNEVNPDFPIAWDEDRFTLDSRFVNPVWGVALYHRSTLTTHERLTIELALRLDYEHTALNYHSHCSTSYTTLDASRPGAEVVPFNHHTVDLNDHGNLSKHFFQFLPRLNVSYNTGMKVLSSIYLTVAKGYKAGGFNTQMFSDVLQQSLMETMGLSPKYDVDDIVGYRPEKSWNFEIGGQILDGRNSDLSASFSAFYIDCRDQQLTMFPDGTTTGRIMANAGHTRSTGVELQASYNPASIPGLAIRASYGYTDARFLSFHNGIRSYDNLRVPYAPSNTLFLDAGYTLRLRSLHWLQSISFSASGRGLGNIYWDEENLQRQPFYMQLGAVISFRRLDSSLDLWVENLTDTRFTTFQYKSMGNIFFQAGKPRRFGVTLRYTFGTGNSRRALVEI